MNKLIFWTICHNQSTSFLEKAIMESIILQATNYSVSISYPSGYQNMLSYALNNDSLYHLSILLSSSSHLKNSCLINIFNNWAYPASIGCHMPVAFATPYHTNPPSSLTVSLKRSAFCPSRLSLKRTKLPSF